MVCRDEILHRMSLHHQVAGVAQDCGVGHTGAGETLGHGQAAQCITGVVEISGFSWLVHQPSSRVLKGGYSDELLADPGEATIQTPLYFIHSSTGTLVVSCLYGALTPLW